MSPLKLLSQDKIVDFLNLLPKSMEWHTGTMVDIGSAPPPPPIFHHSVGTPVR